MHSVIVWEQKMSVVIFLTQLKRTWSFSSSVLKTRRLMWGSLLCRYGRGSFFNMLLPGFCTVCLHTRCLISKRCCPSTGPGGSSETWCDPHELGDFGCAVRAMQRPGCVCEEEGPAVCRWTAHCESQPVETEKPHVTRTKEWWCFLIYI